MSRDRSLDEFAEETPESDEDTPSDTSDADTPSGASDADTPSDTSDVTEETAVSDAEPTADTESATVELPDPDDLAPLRPTFTVDPEGTCSRCGAAVTTRWWDDTGDTDTAGDAGAGYVCADCKEW